MAQVALPPSSTWRVTLFRGVRDGDLDVVKRVSEQHPHSIHEKFTEAMHDWELEWDSVRWFEYREATCLFLACAHTHPHIVEWLIENGVDTDTECGHHQKAIDVIGLSNDNPAKNKAIKTLLKQPKKVPKPPPEPSCRAKIGFEEVVKVIYVDVPHQNPNRPPIPTPKRVAETVAHCKVTVTWRCYWHLPGLSFQLRHKVDDPRGDDIDLKWVYDDVNGHTRTISGLKPSFNYAFQARAKNSAGWSEWSPVGQCEMPVPR